MNKMVVMMDVYGERSQREIIRTVADFHGVHSITMNSKDGKLTVIGDFDSRKILTKLEKEWRNAEMATFGPYDPKKEEAAAEKKRMEERERERLLEASRGINSFYGPTHHHVCVSVCDQEPPACIIS